MKISTNDASKKACDLTGCQLTEIPGLFAESENEPYRKTDKTGIRVSLEKRYPDAFISPVISSPVTSISIRDGMQDIFMSPLQHHVTFWGYFELFWDSKVRRSFHVSSTVIFDFDKQNHAKLLPKSGLQVYFYVNKNVTEEEEE